MSRPNLDLQANMAVVAAHLPMLSGCVRRAFDTYVTHYPPLVRADHDNAAAAKNVHRHLLTEISVAIAETRGVKLLEVRGLNVLNIHDKVVIRFKKMNEEGHSASYPTGQALDYARQLPIPDLPPAATRLTFGYEPDLAWSAILRVLLACPLGLDAHWCVQVNDEPDGATSWTDITPRRLPGTERFRPYGTTDDV